LLQGGSAQQITTILHSEHQSVLCNSISVDTVPEYAYKRFSFSIFILAPGFKIYDEHSDGYQLFANEKKSLEIGLN